MKARENRFQNVKRLTGLTARSINVKIESCTITQKYLSDCYEIAYTYSSHGGVPY